MQLTHANERLARAKASASSAQAAVMERMEQLKAEYNTLSSDRQTNDKQLAALRHEATTIENDVRSLRKLASSADSNLLRYADCNSCCGESACDAESAHRIPPAKTAVG